MQIQIFRWNAQIRLQHRPSYRAKARTLPIWRLFQLDGLVFQGNTGWHTNQCSGFRVVKCGAMSCRSTWGEESDNDKPGDVWFEEASYPVCDSTPEDGQVSMIRGIITTADYIGKGAGGFSLDNQSTILNGRTDFLLYLHQPITLK